MPRLLQISALYRNKAESSVSTELLKTSVLWNAGAFAVTQLSLLVHIFLFFAYLLKQNS